MKAMPLLVQVRGRTGRFAPVAARCRSCSSSRQRTCAAQCLGCQFAARGRAGRFAPWAARCRSCSSSRQRTSAGVAPRAIRGAWPRGTIRALGSSLTLVLIEPSAHVRGPVPGLSIRANGRRLNAAPVRKANSRARRGLSFGRTRRGRVGNETLQPKQKGAGKLSCPLLHIRGSNKGKS